jgi:hypothetical protein
VGKTFFFKSQVNIMEMETHISNFYDNNFNGIFFEDDFLNLNRLEYARNGLLAWEEAKW